MIQLKLSIYKDLDLWVAKKFKAKDKKTFGLGAECFYDLLEELKKGNGFAIVSIDDNFRHATITFSSGDYLVVKAD